ncbi:MAG TPA: pyruvate dehydrogenase (acetyl-transferring) E1 component subunit alpha [Methanomassiliicoccales archaeon]|nr:pyruvate dehydrogenase (acetyl-transferring) E1 component subunit alpha [Methanomassiliicoccales archaeon]HNX47645.1 pyruvate dehydrogenase (acetyl-transferring) E1 component subunit alpha [Methanomassiliicoccales archaeon]HPR97926.1 pyruvate dehydrogenase (acetyl-transferring) E1 component subunit alpha [Methanomassiliicoccales archaeon]HSA35471.1 pyruvate dehydrogenase (acetyl-transferring) E1 component subunit alpha [Methanomassiliicoccales archaeon]
MLTDDFDPMKGEMLQIMDEDGNVDSSLMPKLSKDLLLKAYRNMLLTRLADDKAVKLQRQGRLGAYPPSKGQEASQLGPAMALNDNDWLVWAFREMGALLWKGVPLQTQYLYWMGNELGNVYPNGVHVTPSVVPVGSQVPHAVGIAYASKLRGEKDVTLAYFGDGATSEGDFHEGLNFAGVFRTANVFVCQNNQFAISTRRNKQSASATLAQKAVAYGFPGILVDGNDVLAMYAATKEAVDRARNGEGPTLIESYTYRLSDHTTSDDWRKYRSKEEVAEWERKDPLKRFRSYLVAQNMIKDDEPLMKELTDIVERAAAEAEAVPAPTRSDAFVHTYAEMPPYLRGQMGGGGK